MLGANLLEITPTATASLLALLRKKIRERNGPGADIHFYLDPMTYCFGPYIDPDTGKKRTDLDALKSTRTNRQTKKKFTAVKDSYSSLAAALGPRFQVSVNDGVTCSAIDPSAISESDRNAFCKGVIDYQLNRVEQLIAPELEDDEVLQGEFQGIGTPDAVFAPYFFLHETWISDGFPIAIDLIRRSVNQKPSVPIHAIVCASRALLRNANFVDELGKELLKTGAAGVWLWFDGYDELRASLEELVAFRSIVSTLGKKMRVYNLHGGYFSMLLAHDGLTGISHGVGYGERSDVAKIIGAAAPTVRYYLPAIRKRVGVPDIQRCFPDVGVASAADFFREVCDCAICKGVIGNDLDRFAAFGQMHRARPEASRDTQTPAAAKMCRYHFLLNRFKERGIVSALDADRRASHISETASAWRNCFPLRQDLGNEGNDGYIERWAQALAD